ncbi:amidohydrolase [Streptomyces sp. TLI_171]|uniref:amidohydrolase n=1 Tax=Streptomyces sp. TLI_171 TaxID=1938859 RepID=UPI000C175F25|nr:amidohydrolase [Streptomyces sp. TLI_171]RKE19968.1 cytosine/adenosine deaminase-related metal-dependent hydrolase [Streptomyces sp. TLI_171]
MHATLFRQVRPFGGPVTDLVAVDGLLATGLPTGVSPAVVEGGGRIALPTLVDAHIHPDKTGWGEPWYSRRPAGSLPEYVAGDVDLYRRRRTPLAERAHRLLAHAVTRGTRAVRAHVDVAPVYGLAGVTGLREAAARLAGRLDVQSVAFPQHGVLRTPGVAELLTEAARERLVDAVGGIDPAGFDGGSADGREQLDLLFGLAERYGVLLDVHLHDRGATGLGPLRALAARTMAAGLQGRVTVSHAFCVPELAGAELDALAELLATAGIALTTVAPSAHQVLPFRELRARGVRVGLGSDGVRDSWSPYGNADMLHRAHLLGWTTDARTDRDLTDCLELAAHGGAELLGLPKADLAPGSPADFLLVDGECTPQVVVDLPARDLVVKAGRVVAEHGALVD